MFTVNRPPAAADWTGGTHLNHLGQSASSLRLWEQEPLGGKVTLGLRGISCPVHRAEKADLMKKSVGKWQRQSPAALGSGLGEVSWEPTGFLLLPSNFGRWAATPLVSGGPALEWGRCNFIHL